MFYKGDTYHEEKKFLFNVGICINIKFDHENAFVEVVRRMIDVHHLTNLHFMAGFKGNQFSEFRLNAFRRVLEEHGLPFDESMVSYGDFYSVAAERETEKIVASGNIPQAILCANDRMALAVCDVLDKHGIRVPVKQFSGDRF